MGFRWINLIAAFSVFIFFGIVSFFISKYVSKKKYIYIYDKYFILTVWLLLIAIEIIQICLYAFMLHYPDVYYYFSLNMCTIHMFILPFFLKQSKEKIYKILFNFYVALLFITTFFFLTGMETYHIEKRSISIPDFYHSWAQHILIVITFFHFLFNRRRMYSELSVNVLASGVLFGSNAWIFFMSEALYSAGVVNPIYEIYNRGIFDAQYGEYISNVIVFVVITVALQLLYILCFYLQNLFEKIKIVKSTKI